jgi:hypothetical protein
MIPVCEECGQVAETCRCDDTAYRLTPKGFLAVALLDAGINDKNLLEVVWDKLTEYCEVTVI